MLTTEWVFNPFLGKKIQSGAKIYYKVEYHSIFFKYGKSYCKVKQASYFRVEQ